MKPRRARHSRLKVESLEKRRLLAGDVMHNADMPSDVNGDAAITASDALGVINHLIRADDATGNSMMVDVNADGEVTVNDALRVINDLIAEAEATADDDVPQNDGTNPHG